MKHQIWAAFSLGLQNVWKKQILGNLNNKLLNETRNAFYYNYTVKDQN